MNRISFGVDFRRLKIQLTTERQILRSSETVTSDNFFIDLGTILNVSIHLLGFNFFQF